MPYCSNCGEELSGKAKFCPNCGQPVGQTVNRNQRKQSFQGEIIKCPNCGEILDSFQTVCPSCGFEFRNAQSSNAVKIFEQKLEKLEENRQPDVIAGGLKGFLGLEKTQIDHTDEKILSLIRSFNVPNTKEDVWEFMILASSNINLSAISANESGDAGADSYEDLNAMLARNDAWIAKMKQVYAKARISFGSEEEFQKIQRLYNETLDAIEKAQKEKTRKKIRKELSWWMYLLPLFGISVLCFIMSAIM